MRLCDYCSKASRRTVRSYWGAEICAVCAPVLAEFLDRADVWPVPPWEFEGGFEWK